jgi:hypothetical protein
MVGSKVRRRERGFLSDVVWELHLENLMEEED